MNKLFSTVLVAASIFSPGFSRQLGPDDYMDNRPNDATYMAVLGTVNFNVSKMKINHKLSSVSNYDNFFWSFMDSMLDTYKLKGDERAARTICSDPNFASTVETFMYAASFASLVDFAQSFNVGSRTYTFMVPAKANYRIEARLTGGIDHPRNRVIISGAGFSRELDNDSPGSDVTKIYNVTLDKGVYSVTMCLGTGSSAVFHNAGTLTSVYLDGQASWKEEIVIGSGGDMVLATMPYVGATVTSRVKYRIPNESDFENILVGSAITDINSIRVMNYCAQPVFYVGWRAEEAYYLYVDLTTLSFNGNPYLNPASLEGVYSFRRGADIVKKFYVKGSMPQKTTLE